MNKIWQKEGLSHSCHIVLNPLKIKAFRRSFWFESTSAHQNTTFMQEIANKVVFFFAFLYKYSLDFAISLTFGL